MATSKHRRLWRVLVPAALAAAAATILVVGYLGRGTGIPAIKSAKTPSAEGRKLRFECRVTSAQTRWQWKSPWIATEWVERTVAMEQLPKGTVEYVQSSILERFLADPNLRADALFDVDGNSFGERVAASLYASPVTDDRGGVNPDLWVFRVVVAGKGPDGEGKPAQIASLLVGEAGEVLYEPPAGTRDWAVGYCQKKPDGIYLDIVDRWSGGVEATGTVTEYVYKTGDSALTRIREVPGRVDVMRYINDYFDGKYHNGKQ